MKIYLRILIILCFLPLVGTAYADQRENFDCEWSFAFGDASSPEKDFGCGTEYFNYLTKANSIHNEGPYSPKFDPAKWGKEWKTVNLPHDWVVDLPFAPEASHSHGYKTVGYRYPQTSVGWYRKVFEIPEADRGRHLWLEFEGIFRDARVWVNGFYLGNEPSGYAAQIYDISEYLNYGGENLVTVRADATLEEGWFYEGAGIYRHVWLHKADPLHVSPFGVFIRSDVDPALSGATVTVEVSVDNRGLETADYEIRNYIILPDGSELSFPGVTEKSLLSMESRTTSVSRYLQNPRLWSLRDPYRYTLRTDILRNGEVVDTQHTRTGIRDIRFDPDNGFYLNGENIKLKGVNLHQDFAGVGTALPDALQTYRLAQLKQYGVNACRGSHNPLSPAMIEACDSLGILLIEENRLTGVNDEHVRLLRNMIERDRNHPSIILWSVGNEEWGTEWNEFGSRISAVMREHCHRMDPSRLMTIASAGGPTVLETVDVAGYNYILQNPIEQLRDRYPQRVTVGSEETTGCGARGVYFDDHDAGLMTAINRSPSGPDSIYNAIERGWKFYADRPWTAGVFYWTGMDYRGEPNPMAYPSTGSQFGVLDYCCFPKDEAYYLKAWWTEEPVLHILPHWNLSGHEGEEVDLWAYSDMDEVELFVNGKSAGRKEMPRNGHLSWKATYKPGSLKAVGYRNGKKTIERKIETAGAPESVRLSADRNRICALGGDVAVVTVEAVDAKGRLVPDACLDLDIETDGPLRILGVGNGNPAFLVPERPTGDERRFSMKTFNGLARILLQTTGAEGEGLVNVNGKELKIKITKQL